jgi:hypothetical protein
MLVQGAFGRIGEEHGRKCTVVIGEELVLDAFGHGGLAAVATDGDSGHVVEF